MKRTLQTLFQQKRDQEALDLLFESGGTIREWANYEDSLSFVREGFKRTDFWRQLLVRACPLLYERLTMSETRMANAKRAVSWTFSRPDNFWRCMLLGVFYKYHTKFAVNHAMFTDQGADEFGADWIHMFTEDDTFWSLWGGSDGQRVSSFFEHESPIIKSWPLSFQRSVLFLTLDNRLTIVPVQNTAMSIDLDMGLDPIIIQSEDSVAVIVNQETGLRLFLDGQYEALISDRIENAPIINAGCFVLDKYLLVQETESLQMVAHARNNPRSRYFVAESETGITLMIGLFNIVATVDYESTLTIYKVIEEPTEPFFRLDTVYSLPMIDLRHPPLLYGPFCLVMNQNGEWWRIRYEGVQNTTRMDLSHDYFKMATWRYRVVNSDTVLFIKGE